MQENNTKTSIKHEKKLNEKHQKQKSKKQVKTTTLHYMASILLKKTRSETVYGLRDNNVSFDFAKIPKHQVIPMIDAYLKRTGLVLHTDDDSGTIQFAFIMDEFAKRMINVDYQLDILALKADPLHRKLKNLNHRRVLKGQLPLRDWINRDIPTPSLSALCGIEVARFSEYLNPLGEFGMSLNWRSFLSFVAGWLAVQDVDDRGAQDLVDRISECITSTEPESPSPTPSPEPQAPVVDIPKDFSDALKAVTKSSPSPSSGTKTDPIAIDVEPEIKQEPMEEEKKPLVSTTSSHDSALVALSGFWDTYQEKHKIFVGNKNLYNWQVLRESAYRYLGHSSVFLTTYAILETSELGKSILANRDFINQHEYVSDFLLILFINTH